ncbi:MAG: hypothetical protein L3K03_06925 [Thermoplasmata archaeon]|nr:hypothetical protein [Thermoplasmata archaeon]
MSDPPRRVLVLAALLIVSGGSGISSAQGGLGPTGHVETAEVSVADGSMRTSPGISQLPTPHATPHVNSTINLWNGTTLPGNWVPPPFSPSGIATNAAGTQLFLALYDANAVSVVSPATGMQTALIPVGVGPAEGSQSMALDSALNEVYVANEGSNNVSVISTATDQVVATVPVGSDPFGLSLDPTRGELYVTNGNSPFVSVISLANNTVVRSIPLEYGGAGIAYDSGTGQTFVGGEGSANLTVINDSSLKVVHNIPLGADPFGVAYDPVMGEIFTSNWDTDNVSVVSDSTDQVVGSVPVGTEPYPIAYDPYGSVVLVGNYLSANVSVINDSSDHVTANIATGVGAHGIAEGPGGAQAYVADQLSDSASEISLTALRQTATFGRPEPLSIALNNRTNDWDVSNFTEDAIDIVPAQSSGPISFLPTLSGPDRLEYDGGANQLFASEPNANQLQVWSGSTSVPLATIPVGVGPRGIAYAPSLGEVYVANTGSGNLSVISDASDRVVGSIDVGLEPVAVAFDPRSGNLYVANCGSNSVSVVSTALNELVGSIGVGSCPEGVVYDPALNLVAVANTLSDNVSIISATNESVMANLIVGTTPSVLAYDNDTGAVVVSDYGDSNITFLTGAALSNRSDLAVGSGPVGLAVDPAIREIVVCNSASGTLSVISDDSTLPQEPVTFTEQGLRNGATWSVTVGLTSEASDNSTAALWEVNGSYNYSVMADGYRAGSGTFSVNMAPVAVAVHFVLVTYNVTFSESGLPSGGGWYLNASGESSVLSTMAAVTEPWGNGSYVYYVASVNRSYAPMPVSTPITVAGNPVETSVHFQLVTFAVTFVAHGLPASATWVVNITGQPPLSSTSAVITIDLPNGTYPLTVPIVGSGSSESYAPEDSIQEFTVDGSNLTEVLTFQGEPPGTCPGYNCGATNTPATPNGGLFGLPGAEGYAVLTAIAAAVGLALLLSYRRGFRFRAPSHSSGKEPPETRTKSPP